MGRAFLVVLFALAAVLGVCQGVVWDRTTEGFSARADVDASGNMVVATFKPVSPGGSAAVCIDHFSANGTLLAHVVDPELVAYVGPSFIRAVTIKNGYAYILAVIDSGSGHSYLHRYSLTERKLVAKKWLSPFAGPMKATGLAVGETALCILGSADGGLSVIQRRSVSSLDIINTETPSNINLGQVAWKSGDDFVVNASYFDGTNTFFRIYRVGTSITSFDLQTPAQIYDIQLAISRNGLYAYSAGRYWSLGGDLDISVRPFVLSTNAYLPEMRLEMAMEDKLFDIAPMGTGDACIAGSHRFTGDAYAAGFGPTSNLFHLNVAFGGFDGIVSADSSGNPVVAYAMGNLIAEGIKTFRLKRASGAVMNSAWLGAPILQPLDTVVDSTGTLRMLYRSVNEVNVDQYFHAIQLDPAKLTLPGPYTIGGNSLTGTITLKNPAPTGGATFSLFSNNPAATVPSTVSVQAGNASATFSVTTVPVALNAKPIINARYDGLNLQASFDLAAPLVSSVSASPQSQYGGVPIAGSVGLTGKAPAGGLAVALSSSNSSKISVPASVTVPANALTAAFTMTTFPTLANASSVVTATTGAVSKTVFVAVNAPFLQTSSLSATSVKGGLSTTWTQALNAAAPSGYTIALVSGASAIVQVPGSVTVPSGTASGSSTVSTSPVTSSINVTLIAYRGPYVKTVTLTVTP